MTKGSKAIISICLVFSLILMGMGVYLIFMPETGSQGQVQQGDVNNNNVQNPNVQQNAVNNQIQQNPNANANNRVIMQIRLRLPPPLPRAIPRRGTHSRLSIS